MKLTKGGKARKEWSQEGKARFNTVFAQLKELRSFPVSTSNEESCLNFGMIGGVCLGPMEGLKNRSGMSPLVMKKSLLYMRRELIFYIHLIRN
jgi:hypothetical protein